MLQQKWKQQEYNTKFVTETVFPCSTKYLFVYSLFNDSNSDYLAPNFWLLLNNNEEGNGCCICLVEVLSITKILNAGSRFLSRGSNWALLEQKSQPVSHDPTCSMAEYEFLNIIHITTSHFKGKNFMCIPPNAINVFA
jgi:hypothetical protein